MKENEIEANVFVYHREWGVGQIKTLENHGQLVLVHFQNRPEHRMSREIALRSLNKLPNDGLEATLWNNPETVYSWVKNGPLRLVAAALADAGGAGKPKDLQARLQQRVLRDIKWATWWKKIQPFLKESPHFQVKEGKYILIKKASDVPAELPTAQLKRVTLGEQKSFKTRKLVSSKEWINWLFAGANSPPPANAVPQVVLEILDALPSEMMEDVGHRLLSGLRLILQNKRTLPEHTLESWVFAITQLFNRCINNSMSTSLRTISENLARLTVDLLRQQRYNKIIKDFQKFLSANVEKNDQAAQAIAHSLAVLFQTGARDSVELMRGISDQIIDNTIRNLFTRKVACEVFQGGTPEQHQLMLQATNESDHDYLLKYLSSIAVDGQIPASSVVEVFRKEWFAKREANRPASLNSLLIAVLLLGDIAKPLHPLLKDIFRSVLGEREKTIADPVVAMLVDISREEIIKTRHELEQRLHNEVETVNALLLEGQRETERIRRTADDLQQELSRRREESQLETRRDILLAIGEVLQILSKKDKKSADLISDVQAGLSLALQAGGAEILGQIGQVVSYDPKLHQADKNFNQGASVIITAPGVRVGGGRLGDLVLLKASVAGSE